MSASDSLDIEAEHTLKRGVAEFWRWFPSVAQRFFDTIEAGNCSDLTDETVDFMEQNLPSLAWVFGPGEAGGHSFTVSGEGMILRQLLAEYWHQQAVDLPGWTFFSARQASPVEQLQNYTIQLGDHHEITSDGFQVQTDVDEESESLDIVAWHPLLEMLPEEHHPQILFLLLDEALGEYGTQTWIRNIQIEPIAEDAQHVRSLTELPEYIQSVHRYHGWEKLPPPHSYTVYHLSQALDAPRGDTLTGSSIVGSVFCEYIASEGTLEDNSLKGTGAQLGYLSMDAAMFSEDNCSDERANLEDAIEHALQKDLSGRVLGGAFGSERTYIDLILFDGPRSVEIVEQQINSLQLRNGKLHLID